jgi:hypothetical protein
MLAREVELDNIAFGSGNGVGGEDIAGSANINSDGGTECAGGEGRSGSKGFKLNHFDNL